MREKEKKEEVKNYSSQIFRIRQEDELYNKYPKATTNSTNSIIIIINHSFREVELLNKEKKWDVNTLDWQQFQEARILKVD